MPAASLEVRGLSAGYGPTIVLEDVSFSVPSVGITAVLGRNGVGKTSTLRAILGLIRKLEASLKGDSAQHAPREKGFFEGVKRFFSGGGA